MKINNSPCFFVTGTDTEIGKTLIASALLHCLGLHGLKSIGMKPVAAGAFWKNGVWCNDDVMALSAASNVMVTTEITELMNPYLFKLPAAPHIAAEQESRPIHLATILSCYRQLSTQAEAIVVEGVGGFNVPFNDQEDSADLAEQLGLPVILVVGMRLGCINHALLTAEAIAARGLTLAGWVANSPLEEMAYLENNVAALRERLDSRWNVPLLGCVPWMEKPEFKKAATYLDLSKMTQFH